jgi:hypothetical protein
LLVDAESEQARSFYEHLIPEFERSPTDPLHLLIFAIGNPPHAGSVPSSGVNPEACDLI